MSTKWMHPRLEKPSMQNGIEEMVRKTDPLPTVVNGISRIQKSGRLVSANPPAGKTGEEGGKKLREDCEKLVNCLRKTGQFLPRRSGQLANPARTN